MTDTIEVGGEGEPDPKPAVKRSVIEQSLRAQLDAVLAKNTALRDERDALRARVAELEADYQSLIKRHAFLQESDNAAHARIAELTGDAIRNRAARSQGGER